MSMVWRQWLTRHDRVRDALPAVPLIVIAVAATAVGNSAWHEPHWDKVVWTALSCVPLVVRSRWPLQVALFTLAGDLTLMTVVSHTSPTPAACLVAVYTLALLGDRRTAWIVGFVAAVTIAGVYSATHADSVVGEPAWCGSTSRSAPPCWAAPSVAAATTSRRPRRARSAPSAPGRRRPGAG